MNRLFIILLFLVEANQSSAKTYYSTSEMLEDLNYYITTLEKVHPDLYAYTPKKMFDKRIINIKSRLNKPLTSYEFGRIIAELNSCLDGHTGIPLNAFCMSIYWNKLESYQKKGGLYLPFITIEDTKAYLNGKEIVSINGKNIEQIMRNYNLYYTQADSKRYSNWHKTINFSESKLSYIFYDLKSPFNIVTRTSLNITQEYIEEGWDENHFQEYKKQNGYEEQPSINCDFYFEDSMACINWNNGSIEPKTFQIIIDSIFIQIANNHIKNLFINIAQNTGGYPHGYAIFNKIKHQPFDWKYKRKDKISESYKERFNLDPTYYHINKNKIIHEQPIKHQYGVEKGFSGSVFIIQSPWTYSNGDDFARLANASGRCILVGMPTGQKNRMLSQSLEFRMPNTQITFHCACKDFTYFDCDDDGLCPNINYPIGIYKNNFSRKELIQILRLSEQKSY